MRHHYGFVYNRLCHLTESLPARMTSVLSYPFGALIRSLSLSITASALLGASSWFIRSLMALRTTSLQLTWPRSNEVFSRPRPFTVRLPSRRNLCCDR